MGNCRTSVSFLSPLSTKYTLDLQVDSDLAPVSKDGYRFLRTNENFENEQIDRWTNELDSSEK